MKSDYPQITLDVFVREINNSMLRFSKDLVCLISAGIASGIDPMVLANLVQQTVNHASANPLALFDSLAIDDKSAAEHLRELGL